MLKWVTWESLRPHWKLVYIFFSNNLKLTKSCKYGSDNFFLSWTIWEQMVTWYFITPKYLVCISYKDFLLCNTIIQIRKLTWYSTVILRPLSSPANPNNILLQQKDLCVQIVLSLRSPSIWNNSSVFPWYFWRLQANYFVACCSIWV